MSSKQRKFVRERMVEMARLVTESGAQYNCIIRDISAGGAMLRVPADAQISGRVLITSDTVGTSRAAIVKWRDETSIGVAFSGPGASRRSILGSAENIMK